MRYDVKSGMISIHLRRAFDGCRSIIKMYICIYGVQ
jgi:hypothetical protein